MLSTVRRLVQSACLFLAPFTFLTTAAAHPQAAPAAPAPATQPKIESVAVFPQAASSTSQAAATQEFVLEINGTGFEGIADMSKVYIVVLPAAGVTPPNPIRALSRSLDNKKILAQFSAPANYALEEIALSTGSDLLPFNTGTLSCDFKSKVRLIPQMVPRAQAGNKYGNGVAKNFYAVQLSIVNECPMAIVVPLGGISVVANDMPASTDTGACKENGTLVAFSLDHVTSIFSADRKLTGRRAIYFNTGPRHDWQRSRALLC